MTVWTARRKPKQEPPNLSTQYNGYFFIAPLTDFLHLSASELMGRSYEATHRRRILEGLTSSIAASSRSIVAMVGLLVICFLGSLGCSERPSAQVAQAAPRNLNSMLLQEVTSLANAGDAEAQYHIALRHEAGTGTEKNSVQALIWFKKAADQGYAPAQASLAARIEERATTPDEFREAFELYLAAAKAGHPQAQSRAGQRYDEGRGTIQDYHEALRWFQAAAAQGDAPAQYNLGVAYDEGKGVSIDHKKAVEFYLQAAEQGHMLAQYNLGASYGNGQGVLRDDVQAYKWFALAAAQGRENAAANCQVLVREMAPEQIAEAKKLVADFKPTKGQP